MNIIILKYYVDLNWVSLVGTCIADVLILDQYRHAFCQVRNTGRLFIVKPKANTASVIGVFGW